MIQYQFHKIDSATWSSVANQSTEYNVEDMSGNSTAVAWGHTKKDFISMRWGGGERRGGGV